MVILWLEVLCQKVDELECHVQFSRRNLNVTNRTRSFAELVGIVERVENKRSAVGPEGAKSLFLPDSDLGDGGEILVPQGCQEKRERLATGWFRVEIVALFEIDRVDLLLR